MSAGISETSQRACTECGWNAPAPAFRRVGFFALLRWIPVALVAALIAWSLWEGTETTTRSTGTATFPSILTPLITKVDVESIARGDAPPEVVERFDTALRALCEPTLTSRQRRERITSFAFIEAAHKYRVDERVGWPQPWYWTATIWPCDNAFTFTPPKERPTVRWPEHARWDWYPDGVRVSDQSCSWLFDIREIRYDQQPLNSFSAAIHVLHLGVLALGCTLVALVTSAIVRRVHPTWRWRRRMCALVLPIALLVGVVAIAIGLRRADVLQTRGWYEGKTPARSWEPFEAIGRSDDVLADIAAGRQQPFARLLIDEAESESASTLYLAATVGPTWQASANWSRICPRFETLSVATYDASATTPPEIAAMPAEPGWRWGMRYDMPALNIVSDDGMRRTVIAFEPGAICWLLLACLLAWAIPASILNWWRERRARRRLTRGLCPCCSYPIAPAT